VSQHSVNDGIADFHIAFDDAWARMFAMLLGTPLPDSAVKEAFCIYLSERLMDTIGKLQCSEEDIIRAFPDFLTDNIQEVDI
jgi:hypothetical protein